MNRASAFSRRPQVGETDGQPFADLRSAAKRAILGNQEAIPLGVLSVRRHRRPSRRGVATLVVLLLISIALATSYATVRWQATAVQIQHNAHLGTEARQAAVTGLTLALKKMHMADWEGVDTTLSGSLGPREGYEVTYTTGDPSLAPDDPDYASFPYRVTLLSLGYSADASDPGRSATHQARAVVRLVPRKLADEPDDWDEILDYTLYQYTSGNFRLSVPYRVEGAVRIQQKLDLSRRLSGSWPWYEWADEARWRFLDDLGEMHDAGMGDFRPFDGPLHLPYGPQESRLEDRLEDDMWMGIPTSNVAGDSADDWNHPGRLTTYQIYPGGKVYSTKILRYCCLHDVELEPDVQTNPLGLYYRRGTLWLLNNVKIRGTLVTRSNCSGDLYICGTNVHLEPLDLPPLKGSDQPVQLPVAVLGDDMCMLGGSEASVAGMLAMWDDFNVQQDSQEAAVDLTITSLDVGRPLDDFLADHFPDHYPAQLKRMILAGCVQLDDADAQPDDLLQLGQPVRVFPRVMIGRIVAKDVKIAGREEWTQVDLNEAYTAFMEQKDTEDGTPYFPAWLNEVRGLNPEPRLGIRPDPTEPRYHWKNLDDPIYVPHPDDATSLDPDNPGLRWDLIEWTDNP